MAVTEAITVANLTAFTTTAGTESVVAVCVLPFDNPSGYGNTLTASVNFSTINAATTALTLRIRQASFSAGALVVTTPTGTQIGTTASTTFVAGAAGTVATLNLTALDFAPTLIASNNTIPAQAASLNAPGSVLQGAGVAYVLTVSSTTNTAVVAANAATLTLTQGNPTD